MKRRIGVIRSTPLRLTMVFLGIFVFSSAASFATAYLVLRENYDEVLKDELKQTIETYDAIKDQAELIDRLKADVKITDAELTILYYRPDRGPVIANVKALPSIKGTSVIDATAIGEDQEDVADSYLARGERVGHGELLVAKTR